MNLSLNFTLNYFSIPKQNGLTNTYFTVAQQPMVMIKYKQFFKYSKNIFTLFKNFVFSTCRTP